MNTQISIEEENLTTEDVSRIFDTTPSTVRRWARQGRIPHIKSPGGRYIFFSDEIRELIERERVKMSDLSSEP